MTQQTYLVWDGLGAEQYFPIDDAVVVNARSPADAAPKAALLLGQRGVHVCDGEHLYLCEEGRFEEGVERFQIRLDYRCYPDPEGNTFHPMHRDLDDAVRGYIIEVQRNTVTYRNEDWYWRSMSGSKVHDPTQATLFTRGQFLAIQPRTYLRFEPVEE